MVKDTASQKRESVMQYIAVLRNLMATCKYSAAEYNNQLRDRLLHGCNDTEMQKAIIEVGDELTFETASQAALQYEARQQSLQEMSASNSTQENVNFMQSNCWRCNGRHPPDRCKFKEAKCHQCRRTGHIRSCCPDQHRDTSSGSQGRYEVSDNRGRRQPRGRGGYSRSGRGGYSGSGQDGRGTRQPEGRYNTARGGGRQRQQNQVQDVDYEYDNDDYDGESQHEEYAYQSHLTDAGQGLDTQFYHEDDCYFGIHGLFEDSVNVFDDDVDMFNVKVAPYMINVDINGQGVKMELDTGASRSTISEFVYNKCLANVELKQSNVKLRSYTGEFVDVLGEIVVPMKYQGKMYSDMSLIVVKGDKPALLGRDWLGKIKLDWKSIFKVDVEVDVQVMLDKYKSVFIPDNKGITGLRAQIKLKSDVKPVFQKSRAVPYAMSEEVEKEYDRLVKADILYPVEYSDWGTPVVCVQKQNGGVRICGDYKRLNDLIEPDSYKLPNVQDLLAKMAQAGQPNVFSCLDLSGAFNQLLLDEDAAKVLVLSTHKGLLATKRLTYGVKPAPGQFQAAMDKILAGIDNVFCYIDDILIATGDKMKHQNVLEQVLQRLVKYNVKLNKAKSKFFKNQVQYLGHILTADGIRPVQDKVEGIVKAPKPTDVSQLKSFLGMVNFYGKFIPKLSAELHSLYRLMRNSSKWEWGPEQDQAFDFAKKAIASAQVLVHYDPVKPIKLAVDASPYGIGSVISHVMSDGSERPIAFASRSLSAAKKNYSQLEREALAIIFGVKKFYMYLYGRKFKLETDHQPLTRIFGPKSDVPSIAAARMQRWALILSGYEYEIVHRRGVDNAHADMLSRLPVRGPESADPDELTIHNTNLDVMPVTAREIVSRTKRDKTLSRVLEYTLVGWPGWLKEDDQELQPYFRRRTELTLEDGCVLWGRRVIVPTCLQKNILEELHECHPGMCRMKALARSYVWWPGMDEDIEDLVRECLQCTEAAQIQKKAPLLLWPCGHGLQNHGRGCMPTSSR